MLTFFYTNLSDVNDNVQGTLACLMKTDAFTKWLVFWYKKIKKDCQANHYEIFTTDFITAQKELIMKWIITILC